MVMKYISHGVIFRPNLCVSLLDRVSFSDSQGSAGPWYLLRQSQDMSQHPSGGVPAGLFGQLIRCRQELVPSPSCASRSARKRFLLYLKHASSCPLYLVAHGGKLAWSWLVSSRVHDGTCRNTPPGELIGAAVQRLRRSRGGAAWRNAVLHRRPQAEATRHNVTKPHRPRTYRDAGR